MQRIDSALLEEVIKRLVTALQPERIYLYGSHAYGKPHKDSDVDLLVVVNKPDEFIYDMTVKGYRALRGLFFPAELNVVTQEEFDERSKWFSSIESVVNKKGWMVYESRNNRS
jgi:predicted nucleotidyltransferase